MKVVELTPEQYASLYTPECSVYDSPEFIALNVRKTLDVKLMGLSDGGGKIYVAQAFGLKRNGWRAPFSAPFSIPLKSPEARAGHIRQFYGMLTEELGQKAEITFPADCYGFNDVPEYEDTILDYNYHYPMERLQDYESHLSRSGRYNHHRAQKHPFKFIETHDIARAYEIIKKNREAMGYPLAMSLDEVMRTSPITHGRYFVLTLDRRDVAAAVVFHPVPGVAQVIYWGDIPEARQFRAMNSLPWHLFNWYAHHYPEIHTIDIGPSSTDGEINRGLADYKLSIGCVETYKPTIILR